MTSTFTKPGLPQLPCFPCPHDSSCCNYGTTLSDEEAAAIEQSQGAGKIFRTRWGEWRTRVKNRRCVFFGSGGCTIHDKPYYPTLCQGFPWTDAETGEPYLYDVTICGELAARPDLVQLQRLTRSEAPAHRAG